jgi:hypothetical protein
VRVTHTHATISKKNKKRTVRIRNSQIRKTEFLIACRRRRLWIRASHHLNMQIVKSELALIILGWDTRSFLPYGAYCSCGAPTLRRGRSRRRRV